MANIVQLRKGDRAAKAGAVNIVINGSDDDVDSATDGSPDVITVDDDGSTTYSPAGLADDNRDDEAQFTGGFLRNLAKGADESALRQLAEELIEGIDADDQSRSDWLETADSALKFLGTKIEMPTAQVSTDGTVARAISSVLAEAAAKAWATARGELLPVGGPVKVRDDYTPPIMPVPAAVGLAGQPSPDGSEGPDSVKRVLLAKALESDLNHFLTKTDKEYYPDFSKMLMARYLIGNGFRKAMRDPIKRRPSSLWTKAQDLIVSNDCSHLSAASRVTERIRIPQGKMRRLQAIGHYRRVDLVSPMGFATSSEDAEAESTGIAAMPQLPRDQPHLVYECYCELGDGTSDHIDGLDFLEADENRRKPGYPMPYRVTIDLDSREVLEIRRNWRKDDPDHIGRTRFVKYGYVPGPGFYDWGMVHLIGNRVINSTMIGRASVDAALFQMVPAWVMAKGAGSRQEDTNIRLAPGQVKTLSLPVGQKIQDVLMQLPTPGPSEAALAIQTKEESDARKVVGAVEMPVGEGRIGNTPVGTMLTYVESITQVPSAVHKDDHIAQQEEFEMLRELFAEDPRALWRGRKNPAYRWQVGAEVSDPDLVPAADPNTPTEVHRLMKLTAAVEMSGLPQFAGIADARAIYTAVMEELWGHDGDQYVKPAPPPGAEPPPPPDPKVVAAQINAQTTLQKAQIDDQADQADAANKQKEIQLQGQMHLIDTQGTVEKATLDAKADAAKNHATVISKVVDAHQKMAEAGANHAHDHQQHQDKMALEHRKMDMQGQQMQHDAAMQQAQVGLDAQGQQQDQAQHQDQMGLAHAQRVDQRDQASSQMAMQGDQHQAELDTKQTIAKQNAAAKPKPAAKPRTRK